MQTKWMMGIALLALGTGCVAVSEKPGEEETRRSTLKGAFVSGHLGNYWDCPEDAYSTGSDGDASREAPAADLGACPDDMECTPILNCDGAQFTIRLTNGGELDLQEIEVSRIEIFSVDGTSLAVLPLIQVRESASNDVFDGDLGAGASVDLRVDYRGPASLYDLLPRDDSGAVQGDGDSALIEVTVEADDGAVVIDGGEVFVLPTVVT